MNLSNPFVVAGITLLGMYVLEFIWDVYLKPKKVKAE